MIKTAAKVAGALAALAIGAGIVQAGSIVGLVDGKTVVTIDPATRKVTARVQLKGNETQIVGIDVRPADGMLYGIASNGLIYTIDLKTGQSTRKSKLQAAWKSGVTTTTDFNPVADRMRVMGSHGVSVRLNVDDGSVVVDGSHKFKEGDANAGKTPSVIAGAYTNSAKGAQATKLYNIDATTGSLVLQNPTQRWHTEYGRPAWHHTCTACCLQYHRQRRQEQRVAYDRRDAVFG